MGEGIEAVARAANSEREWNRLWKDEGIDSWRGRAMDTVYARISELVPERARVVDIGGGVGILAKRLRFEKQCDSEVWDISAEAIAQCRVQGIPGEVVDLEVGIDDAALLNTMRRARGHGAHDTFFVATEVLEHLSEGARVRLLEDLAKPLTPGGPQLRCFFSVPNDRLGPDEEPQHTIKWTALSFKRYLERFWNHVRVECHGPNTGREFLLGIVGFAKSFRLSVCFPARDEAADIERVLASFRGVADEMVIGVDPRSVDDTKAIAEKYAETVFELDELRGPPGEEVPEGGFHFAHARNKCMNRCTGDWIFMTEAHEHLAEGADELLHLDGLPSEARVVFVLRQGNGQQWGFPWLCKNAPDLRYKRSTHNVLEYPDTFTPALKNVKTLHLRDHVKEVARAKQRKIQNRITLLEDWTANENALSLYYLASEWREHDEDKALDRFRQFLATGRGSGPARYQARLIMAKHLANRGGKENVEEARQVLYGAIADDWSRTDHWIWLGDLAMEQEHHEEALRFYLYGASRIGDPPFTLFWIDLSFYSYIPAQRLAQAYAALGDYENSLAWARRVIELSPEGAPSEFVEEAKANIRILEEAVGKGAPEGDLHVDGTDQREGG